jgi:hypothetical protein
MRVNRSIDLSAHLLVGPDAGGLGVLSIRAQTVKAVPAAGRLVLGQLLSLLRRRSLAVFPSMVSIQPRRMTRID